MGIETTRKIKKCYENLLVTFEMDRQCDWRVKMAGFANNSPR
jgi:hypothetical protein